MTQTDHSTNLTEFTPISRLSRDLRDAAKVLETKKIGKTTDAYKAYSAGRLPPAHVHARAKRRAVKIFLSHLHEVWFEQHHGRPAPVPYAIAHMDHAHKIERDGYVIDFDKA